MFLGFLKKKCKKCAIGAGVIFLTIIAVLAYGFAPALSVDGHGVGLAEFLKVESALRHFNNIANQSTATTTPSADLKMQALGNIIDRKILDKIVEELDPSINQKADALVRDTLSKQKNLSLDEAANKLYGLSGDDFIKLVLIPQAERDLLMERFKDNPSRLGDIWNNAASHAKIKIYYPGYYWDGTSLKTK